MKNLVEYLKENITDKMPLEDIVKAFQEMCKIRIKESLILFETGTFNFTREESFYFPLTRQFPNNTDGEYYQVHVDVLYKPTKDNRVYNDLVWNCDIRGSIFKHIKNSKSYLYVKVDIYMSET